MLYRAPSFYEDQSVKMLYGMNATAIDAKNRKVTVADGTVLDYDRLCVATGSSPFVPPMVGIEQVQRHFCFMTMDDALALEKNVTPDSRVLIIGAGLIGLKCA